MGWGTRLTVTRVSEWLNKARQRSDLGQTKVAQETNKQTSTFFPTYTCWAQCAIIWYCCSTWKRRGLKRMSFSHLTSPLSRWQKRKLWMKRQAHMLPAGESVLQLDGLRGRSDLYCLDCSVCRLPDLPGNFLLWNLDFVWMEFKVTQRKKDELSSRTAAWREKLSRKVGTPSLL